MPQLPSRNPTIGIVLIVTAMLVVPFMDAIAKLLSAQYPNSAIGVGAILFPFSRGHAVSPLAT